MREQSRVFGEAADAYEAGRPDYPAEAVAWLLDGVRGTVLDLGAGSGKLSRAVAALGFDVIAVDPDERMLARNTTVEARVGTAEAVPLADHSVAGCDRRTGVALVRPRCGRSGDRPRPCAVRTPRAWCGTPTTSPTASAGPLWT